MQPRLSICIPTYNGLPHIGRLLDSLTKCDSREFEVVISDDCSVDGTWEYLQTFSQHESRVRVARNDLNLGMDRNFACSVKLATGEFIWLCGQDDLILPEGVVALIDLIDSDLQLDFVHMPCKMSNNPALTPALSAATVLPFTLRGIGLMDFVASNKECLPSFLPEFVIRRSRWEQADVARYFGTCYCQVGVFLEASRGLRWCRLAECYVEGNLPHDGWQANPLAYARIIFGYFAMLDRAGGQASGPTAKFSHRQYMLHQKQLIYALLMVRAYALEDRVALLGELQKISRKYPRLHLIVIFFLVLPRSFSRLLASLIMWKRKIRGRFGAITGIN